MLFGLVFLCFTRLCFSYLPPSNFLKSSSRAKISVYSEMRNAFHGIFPLEQPSFQQKKRMSESVGPGGAVPFWFEGNRPHIHLWVGSPPQRVTVVLDTGSGYTWVHGPAPRNHSSDLGAEFFDSSLSSSWRPQNTRGVFSYLDSSSCVTDQGSERVSLSQTGSTIDIFMGVENNDSCSSLPHGILGLDRSSDLLKAFSRNKGNLSSIFSLS